MRRLLIALTALVARCEEPQAPAAPPAPISLTIKDVGTLRVDPGVDPADVVEEFAAEARGAGVDVSVDDMRRMHSWFCSYAPCPRPLASTLTARVRGVGSLTVEPYTEPAAAVEALAAEAFAAGVRMSEQQMAEVLAALCDKRPCRKRLNPRLELNVTSVGLLVVEAWEQPADVVEQFAAAAVAAGHALTETGMRSLYEWCCRRRGCARDLAPRLAVNASALGLAVCEPYEEPAAAVERLASDAARRGVAVARGDVDAAMRWFCARRSCSRMPRGLTLEVREVGTLEVFPWNEPAAEVEHFARVAHRAGVDVREALLEDMLAWFCSRRECARAVTPTLTATVETFGTLTLPAWIDPADGVENFAKAALHRAGALVPARTLRSLLEYFCAQRPCARTSIEAPWLAAEPPPAPRAPGNRMPSAFPGIADPKRI